MADLEMQSIEINSLNGSENKVKLPLSNATFFDHRIESGFHQSTRTCFQKVRHAMLHHQWHKAAQYMTSYFQAIEDTNVCVAQQHIEIIWKTGTDILHHLPTTRMEHYNDFYEQMKLLGRNNYLSVSLEHSFHLLANGQLDKANHQLSVAETWRYGSLSEGQSQRVKLVQAYRSLLDYFTWCGKRKNFSTQAALSTDEMAELDMEAVYKKSTVNLKELLKKPGVWDPFILCYVEMLEHYEKHEQVSKVLEDYAYDESFPPNPNAHVYLYRHLKKTSAPENKLRRVLKVLHDLVPSHELMPEYFSLLLHSDKENDNRKALDVSLHMLDYACWKMSVAAWRSLMAAISKLRDLHADAWEDVVGQSMASRRDWWPTYHFTHFHAMEDRTTDPALLRVKARACRILFPENGYIVEWKIFKEESTKLKPSQEKNTSTEPPKQSIRLSRRRKT